MKLIVVVFFSLKVTSLISEQPSNKKKGRSKRAHLLVANVIQATENFINKAGEIAHENPDMRNDLLQSMDEVKRTGREKSKRIFNRIGFFSSEIKR
jgi:catenin alpha